MNEYEFTEDMYDISEQGGDVEKVCRKLVVFGFEWAKNKGQIGIGNAMEFAKHMSDECDRLCLQHNISLHDEHKALVTRHVKFAYDHGWDEYVKHSIAAKQSEGSDAATNMMDGKMIVGGKIADA